MQFLKSHIQKPSFFKIIGTPNVNKQIFFNTYRNWNDGTEWSFFLHVFLEKTETCCNFIQTHTHTQTYDTLNSNVQEDSSLMSVTETSSNRNAAWCTQIALCLEVLAHSTGLAAHELTLCGPSDMASSLHINSCLNRETLRHPCLILHSINLVCSQSAPPISDITSDAPLEDMTVISPELGLISDLHLPARTRRHLRSVSRWKIALGSLKPPHFSYSVKMS